MALVLLVFAIYKIRTLIKQTRRVSFTTREVIMTVHIVLFTSTVLVSLACKIIDLRLTKELQNSIVNEQELCHTFLAEVYWLQIKQVVNLATLILIIYVTNNLCTPLSRHWQ